MNDHIHKHNWQPSETSASHDVCECGATRSLHDQLREVVETFRDTGNDPRAMTIMLLSACPDEECHECGEIMCPHGEPLHFHHDGCPACEEAALDPALERRDDGDADDESYAFPA